MEAILTYLSANYPLIAVILFVAIVVASVVWWAAKFYHRMTRTENEVIAVKTELQSVKTDVAVVQTNLQAVATKAELKEEIAKLKENDFYHTNRAILLLAKYLMPKDNVEGFERIKDNCLETTPENRREEIKSITL
jgi:hypothetical protein